MDTRSYFRYKFDEKLEKRSKNAKNGIRFKKKKLNSKEIGESIVVWLTVYRVQKSEPKGI